MRSWVIKDTDLPRSIRATKRSETPANAANLVCVRFNFLRILRIIALRFLSVFLSSVFTVDLSVCQ